AISAGLVSDVRFTAGPAVRVDGGLIAISIASASGPRSYKGIPYAAPPVGELRWKPPRPVVPWRGAANAAEFSAAWLQGPRYPPTTYATPPRETQSEDCLY